MTRSNATPGGSGVLPIVAASTQIGVCGLADMPAAVATLSATHLISVLDAPSLPATPDGLPMANHLRLGFNDIVRPTDGYVHPTAAHIDELIAFLARWNHSGPLLVHCWAGVSRSTAAAYVALCADAEPGAERRLADVLRRASPSASPNALMIALADDLLGRSGRMVDAIRAIGMGDFVPSRPFVLSSRP